MNSELKAICSAYGVVIPLLMSVVLLSSCRKGADPVNEDLKQHAVIAMDNGDVNLQIDLSGGHYISFELKKNPVNPFGWKLEVADMPMNNRPFVFQGHFLCTGRWGAPSPGEVAAGIPHNGEVNTEKWSIVNNDRYRVVLGCMAPLEKLEVTRTVELPEDGTWFIVREEFTNHLPVGRLFNVVQHGTIAYPLLDANTLIDTNAREGFDQRTDLRYLSDSSFIWPHGKLSGGVSVDLRQVTSGQGFVTSHIFSREDELGWVTATNGKRNIVFGYVWNTREYPWLNLWYHSREGRPHVQGLEFGTTGLGQPYALLLDEAIDFLDRKPFEYLDAGETRTKSWIGFQVTVPDNFRGVERIDLTDLGLVLTERAGGTKVRLKGKFDSFINDFNK